MNKTSEALAALNNRDWTNAEVVEAPRVAAPMVTVATRLPVDLVERLATEAQRRGITPSELLRQFAEDALQPVPEGAVVPLVDALRAIESLARRSAA